MSSDGRLREVLSEIDLADAPAVSQSLVELRHRYDDEHNRRETIEKKINGLLAVNVFLITVASVVSFVPPTERLLILLPIAVSSVLCLTNIRSREYLRPLAYAENVVTYTQSSSREFEAEFLKKYIVSVEHNRRINDRRLRRFDRAFWLTAVAVLLFALAPLWAVWGS